MKWTCESCEEKWTEVNIYTNRETGKFVLRCPKCGFDKVLEQGMTAVDYADRISPRLPLPADLSSCFKGSETPFVV